MRVLVTGGAGFIGSHTVDLLLKKGHDVRVFDNLEPPVHDSRIKPPHVPEDVEFLLGDIQDRSKLEAALKGIDVVFHLAAHQDYFPKFSRFAYVNDGGTALLYEIIVDKHLPIKKVILASSQAVYGEGKYRCPNHGVQYPLPRPLHLLNQGQWDIGCPICGEKMDYILTDEAQVNPHNQYAISKYAQELYALILGRRFNIPTAAMRYTICQGSRQSFKNAYSGILRIFSVCLLHNLPLPIYEDGQQLRDYVYVGDVARANILVMEKEEANYQVYNVGSGRPTSVLEYANLLIRLWNKEVRPTLTGQFRLGDTRHIVSDINKLKQLGWKPTIGIEGMAQEYKDWLTTQPGVGDSFTGAMAEMKKAGVIRRKE